MSWKDSMMKAMSEFVSEEIDREVTVARYEDRTQHEGYCETCSFEYQVLDFYDGDGKFIYTYRGSMADLMEQLTR